MLLVEIPATLAFLFFLASKIRENPRSVLGGLLLMNLGLEMISINFIEMGAYNLELGMATYRQGLVLPLFLCLSVFSYCYFRAVEKTKGSASFVKDEPLPVDVKRICIFLGFVALFIELLGVVLYGAAALTGGNKVTNMQDNKIAAILGGSASYISLCFGILRKHSKKNSYSRFYAIAFILHIIVLVLQGNKFTSLVHNFIAFFAIDFVRMRRSDIDVRRIGGLAIFGGLVLIVFYFIYSGDNQFSRELGISTFEAMGYRAFYLVAHTYWGAHYFYERGGIEVNLGHFLDSARELVRIMNADPNVDESIERGTTFGMAFPAYLYFLVPPAFFLIPSAIFGIVSGKVVNALAKSVERKRYVMAIALFVLMNHIHHIVIQGNFYKIVDPKVFIILAVLLFYMMVTASRRGGRAL